MLAAPASLTASFPAAWPVSQGVSSALDLSGPCSMS